MKLENLQIFPSTVQEIGTPFRRIEPEFLDQLRDIHEEYNKDCKKPIKSYENKIKSLIGKTLTKGKIK